MNINNWKKRKIYVIKRCDFAEYKNININFLSHLHVMTFKHHYYHINGRAQDALGCRTLTSEWKFASAHIFFCFEIDTSCITNWVFCGAFYPIETGIYPKLLSLPELRQTSTVHAKRRVAGQRTVKNQQELKAPTLKTLLLCLSNLLLSHATHEVHGFLIIFETTTLHFRWFVNWKDNCWELTSSAVAN